MPKEIDDDDDDVISGSQQVPVNNYDVVTSEKESTARENNVAKIKVVVCYSCSSHSYVCANWVMVDSPDLVHHTFR